MPFSRRVYVPGDALDHNDLNRIGNGIATVSTEINTQATAMRTNADAKIGGRLRSDGSNAMTGSLRVSPAMLDLYGEAEIDGAFADNNLNLTALDVFFNGNRIMSDASSGMSACFASFSGYSSATGETPATFSSIINMGSDTAPLFDLVNGNQLRILDDAEYHVLITVSVDGSGAFGSTAYTRFSTNGIASISGEAVDNRDSRFNYMGVGGAGVFLMSRSKPIPLYIYGYGRTISAYVTAIALS